MARTGRTQDGARLAPQDVLAGQVVPSAQDLIRLIHEVNPTGQDMTKREAERRYAIKSKLQSLLVQRFREDLVVESGSDEGVVLLRHKYLGVAASHAVVADLGDEARAWVQMQLDLGADEAPSEPQSPHPAARGATRSREDSVRRGPPSSMDEALDQGLRALAEYDFEAARDAFEQAHMAAPLALGPIRALLDLLVHQLGLDADALDLADSLDPDLLESSEVRAPLALAAARAGDRDRARPWAQDLDGPHAAEVHRILAAAALQDGDLAYATAAVELARRSFAADPELAAIEKRLAEAKAIAAKPREAALEEMVARGDLAGAVDLAHQIVAEHPGSLAARRVLKEASAREREAQQTTALAEVQSALAEGDARRARQALTSACALGARDSATAKLEEAVCRIEDAAREAAERAEIDAVVQQLARAKSPAGIGAALEQYLSLDRRLRSDVSRKASRKEVTWLDEVDADDESRLRKLVPAVVALGIAEAELSAGNPEAALAGIGPHRASLRDLQSARAIIASAETAAEERRRTEAESFFSQAKEAFAAGDLVHARTLIETLRQNTLAEERRRELEALRDTVVATQRRQEQLGLLERHFQSGDLIRARHVLIRLLAAGGAPDEISRWQAYLADVESRLRKQWIVLDHELAPGLRADNAPDMAWPRVLDGRVEICLLPGARSALFATARGRLIFVRIVEVDSGEIRRLLILRSPEALGWAIHGLADNCLWIIGEGFQFLEISCEDWLPRRWCSLKPHVASDMRLESGVAIPQAEVVWLRTTNPPESLVQQTSVIDMVGNRPLRSGGKDIDLQHIPGTAPPLVARINYEEVARVVGARGAALVDLSLTPSYRVLEVARHPSGAGFLALAFAEQAEEDAIEVFVMDARGAVLSQIKLPGDGERCTAMASVLPGHLSYLCYHDVAKGEERIVLLSDDAGKFEVSADASTHGHCGILQDEAATAAVAFRTVAGGVELTRLSDTPPRFVGNATRFIAIPMLEGTLWCSPILKLKLDEGIQREFYLVPETQRPAWAMERCQSLAKSPEALLCLCRCLHGADVDDTADEILHFAMEHHPQDVYVRMAVIERDARAGRWTGDALWTEADDAHVREHLCHLKGFLLLQSDKPKEAIKVWSDAPNEHCRIESLLELAKALVAARSGEKASDADELPDLPGLIHAAFRADKCSAQGDADGARRALDRAWIRAIREEQTLARLAEIYLSAPAAADPVVFFRTATLLAEFVDVHRDEDLPPLRLWLCEGTWDARRVEALLTRAAAWLEQMLGGAA